MAVSPNWMRSRGGIVLLSVLACLSCRDVVDFDEPATSAQSELLLPFVPASDVWESCTTCARTSCGELRTACLADPDCRELLRCRAACSQPACMARCGSYSLFGSSSAALQDYENGAQSQLFLAYDLCVSGQECHDACGVGLNWSCLHSAGYRWPVVSQAAIPVELEVIEAANGRQLAAHVQAWNGSYELVDEMDTGSWGQLALTLERSLFTGYFSVMPSVPHGFVPELYYPVPVFRRARGNILVFTPTTLAPHPGDAMAFIFITDCLGYPASGVRFELEGRTSQFLYQDANSSASDADSTLQYGTGIADITNPPEQPVTVVATRDGVTVARKAVLMRPDQFTLVELAPKSADN